MRFYALSCGSIRCRKNVFVPDAPRGEIIHCPMPVFVILHPQGNILFDTGPHPSVFPDAYSRWGGLAKAFEPLGDERCGIVDRLESIHLEPKDIRYVVNSHLHFDHAGGNQFFPNSIFLVSKQEFDWARNPENEGKGYFQEDWKHSLRYQEVEGPLDIYKDGSLVVIPLPGHTPGHQGMLVRLKGKRLVVLTGDSVPCQENFLYSIIPRNHLDPDQALRTIQKLHELMKEEKAFLIYGHDPVQWEKIKEPPDYYD